MSEAKKQSDEDKAHEAWEKTEEAAGRIVHLPRAPVEKPKK